MNKESHGLTGWVICSPISVEDEVVTVEVAIPRGGVTSCNQPRKCA